MAHRRPGCAAPASARRRARARRSSTRAASAWPVCDRRLGEVADRPQALHVVVRGVAAVEHAPQLVVRVGVAAGAERGDPARVLHVGERGARVRRQRHALDLGRQPRARRRGSPRRPASAASPARARACHSGCDGLGARAGRPPRGRASTRASSPRCSPLHARRISAWASRREPAVGAQRRRSRRRGSRAASVLVPDRGRGHAVEAHRAPVAVGVGQQLGQTARSPRRPSAAGRPRPRIAEQPRRRRRRAGGRPATSITRSRTAGPGSPHQHRRAAPPSELGGERGVVGQRLLGHVGERARRGRPAGHAVVEALADPGQRARGPAARAAAPRPRRSSRATRSARPSSNASSAARSSRPARRARSRR